MTRGLINVDRPATGAFDRKRSVLSFCQLLTAFYTANGLHNCLATLNKPLGNVFFDGIFDGLRVLLR